MCVHALTYSSLFLQLSKLYILFFKTFFICVCVCVCVHMPHVGAGSPVTGSRGGCDQLDVGAGNAALVPWKSSKHSYLMICVLSP